MIAKVILPLAVLATTLMVLPADAVTPLPRRALGPFEPGRGATELIAERCVGCHDGASGEGGFDASALLATTGDPAVSIDQVADQWTRVHDRVAAGEMPPPQDDELTERERQSLALGISESLSQGLLALHQSRGRAMTRRLTNAQLENTLHDLLAIDTPLASQMPTEPRVGGFVNQGNLQTMSHFHVADHLAVIDLAIDEAFEKALGNRQVNGLKLPAEKIARKRPGQRNRDPEMRDGLAVVWSSQMAFYGRITNSTARHPGWYRIRLKASAVRPPKNKDGTTEGLWCTIRSGACVSSSPLMAWIDSFMVTEQPQTFTFEAFLPEGHMLEVKINDITVKQARFAGGQVGFGEGESQGAPGIGMHELVIEPIEPNGDADQTRQRLFGDDARGPDAEGRYRFKPPAGAWLAERLTQFASAAYRRPTDTQSITGHVDLAQSRLEQSGDPVQALRTGYRSLLCSPRFLFHLETTGPRGRLDDWSLANRLSYFLTDSMPDDALAAVAARADGWPDGSLPEQTDRLLATKRGERFMRNFAEYWLDLVDISETDPDRKLFREYDVIVQDAMLAETRAFMDHLLEQNRPVAELISADYTFVNERLARFYDLPVDAGGDVQRVSLAGDVRGGLLTHGSILKITANGNDTSPVLRGVWVSTHLLGRQIPGPPENVPAVEPDIRGATTIRELLAKHTSDASCAACHRQFDAPGFALENFDAAGRWRDHYPMQKGKRLVDGPVVDPSAATLRGEEFKTFEQYRNLLAKQPEVLATNLVSQWLRYATGTPVDFADRSTIGSIVDSAAAGQYRFASLLHQLIASDAFTIR